jgi:hypothetical protein
MKSTTMLAFLILLLAGSFAQAQHAQRERPSSGATAGHGERGGMTGMMCGDMMGQGGGMMGGGMMGGGMMGGGMMGHGGGMMGMMGRGGGMMGEDMMGAGMMGASPEKLAMDPRIPQDKRSQLRDLTLAMAQGMVTKAAELQNHRLALMKAAHAFPIDQAAVKTAREGMQRAMGDMLALRMDTMAKIQQILGKDMWERLHPGWYGPRPEDGQSPAAGDAHGHGEQSR